MYQPVGRTGRALFAAVIVGAAAQAALGQCLDWAFGFGIPGSGINGEVLALAAFDDGSGPALYAGGNFSSAGGVPAAGVARWNGTGWGPVGSGLGIVYTLTVHDDETGPALYAGGGFGNVGGVPFNRMAKWTGSAWVPVGSGMDNGVRALASFDADGPGGAPAELYAAGGFTTAGGVSANNIAKWDGVAWAEVNSSGYGVRESHVLAYDAARGQTVLFGGFGGGLRGDTWVWDGGAWTRAATTGPSPRTDAAMVYDPIRQRVLLFGGITSTIVGDLWAWNGAAWSQLELSFPSNRRGFAVAFDEARDRLVLFGGRVGASSYQNDTWEWDGTDWVRVAAEDPEHPQLTPPRRAGHAMAYDAARGRVVLFGGYNPVTGVQAETWLWDGTTWQNAGAGGPSGRERTAMSYDSARQRVVMTGGSSTNGTPDTTTWEWDGSAWAAAVPAAPREIGHAMAYDAARGRTVLAGTAGGTWEYTADAWLPRGGGPNNAIYTLAVHDEGSGPALFAGGEFDRVNGMVANRVVRWNGLEWSTVGLGVSSAVNALAPYAPAGAPSLYACGAFTHTGNLNASYIARWDGAAWSRVGDHGGGGGLSGPGQAMTVFDDGSGPALYVAGGFSTANGQPASRIARWDGATWSPLGVGIGVSLTGQVPRCLAAFDGGSGPQLFVAGDFTHAGEKPSRSIAVWPVPCTPPSIVQQPVDHIAVYPQPATFSVTATGTASLTYQWRRNGTPLADVGPISGATTPQLSLRYWSLSNAGAYDVVITNTLGTVTSDPVTLTVPNPGDVDSPVNVVRVLHPPEPVPGVPGQVFESFNLPISCPSGEITFLGYTPSAVLAQWSPEAVRVLQRTGGPAPGTASGVTFQGINGADPFVNFSAAADGRVAFTATLGGPGVVPSVNGRGLWYQDAEGVNLVARTGSPAAGAGGRTFSRLGLNANDTPRAMGNGAGQLVFGGRLSGTPVQEGLWLWSRQTGQQLLHVSGDQAPGTSAVFTAFGDTPQLNSAGTIAFHAHLNSTTGFNYTGGSDTGIWAGPMGGAALIARSGEPAPGLAADINLEYMDRGALLQSQSGVLTFAARVAGPNGYLRDALYRWSAGSLQPLALPSQPAPGASPGSTFLTPTPMAVSTNGNVLFRSTLSTSCTPPCPTKGVWLAAANSIFPVVLDHLGTPPAAPPGSTFVEAESGALNNQRHVVLSVRLGPSITRRAVYGWTPRHGLFPIAVPGSQIEVGPDDYRTVDSAFLSSTQAGSVTPNSSSLTSNGEVVFRVTFTDNTRGIFAGSFRGFLYSFYPCAVDWNVDTAVSSSDISAFLTSWLQSLVAGDLVGDFDEDGATDATDISAFLAAWLDAVHNGC